LKIAVIADSGKVPRFARDALAAIEGCEEITLFSCTNSTVRRRLVRHLGYYALNAVTIRNPLTRLVDVAGGRKRVASSVEFASGYDGAWQTLPPPIVAALAEFDVVLKFGMSLLRVPPAEELPAPILSYHHGDPDRFRGRPMGFWETAEGVPTIGQMIQRITNRLDGGQVAAFAETRVYPHSYRATLMESYRHSKLLINQGIRNALAGTWLQKPCNGRNYRLPSNWQVARFVARMASKFAGRLAYGALVEKRWHVSLAPAPLAPAALAEGAPFPPESEWRELPAATGYAFYADPFFAPESEGVLVEAMDARSGWGEIVLVKDNSHRAVLSIAGHLSYPCTVEVGSRRLVLPEMAIDSEQKAYVMAEDGLREAATLRFPEPVRIVDPTLIEHDGRLYLFGNRLADGASALFLWSAPTLEDVFVPHPAAPVQISPRGGRMAGNIVRTQGRLIRFGQTFLTGYGDGIVAFEIEALGPERYREREIGQIAFERRRGPHTLNFGDGLMVFDWYEEVVSPLAGVRRWRARSRAAPPPRAQALRPIATQ
jgi:hypothetical protein